MQVRKNRKLLGLVGLLVVLGLLAGACGSDGEVATGGDDGFRIAIVAPSASNDLAFSQSIVDGVGALTGVSAVDVTDGTFIVDLDGGGGIQEKPWTSVLLNR